MTLAIIMADQRAAISDQAPKRNRHPVDELADIRAEQKRMKEREDELKAAILAAPDDTIGFDHEAIIQRTEAERVDTKAVREILGEKISQVIRKSETVTIRTTKRQPPEAA